MSTYFYPRSPCGERQPDGTITDTFFGISIHALLAESDCFSVPYRLKVTISIHALLAESDHIHAPNRRPYHYFYPRSPCGERRLELFLYYQGNKISIHALLAESDIYLIISLLIIPSFLSTLSLRRATPGASFFRGWTLFLSTLSLRRATPEKSESLTTYLISIHALLAESD